MPASIVILRHAEKQLGSGPPRGVTEDGEPDPGSLTPRGWQRAGALVPLFVPEPTASRKPALATPDQLVACQGADSRRPLETLEPLSARVGRPVDASLRKEQVAELVDRLRGLEGAVVIAWEHKHIPALAVALLGDAGAVPGHWPDDRFDICWIFEPTEADPGYAFRQLPQMLLAGDRAEVVDG